MPQDTTCDFCGAEAHAWCGNLAWCRSTACQVRFEWATCEPNLIPWMDPTPMQRFGGWLMFLLYEPIRRVIPARWLIYRTGWREKVALWAYSNSDFWDSRAGGLL